MSQGTLDAFGPSIPTSVTTDIPCRKCGYNLRGLTTDTRCPECGINVAASVSGDLLRYCDPAWVTLLARGAKLIILGVAVIILGIIASLLFVYAIGPQAAYLSPFAGLAGNVLIVIGSWLVTTPDPSGVGEDKYGTSRKIIRIALLIGIVNTVLNVGGRLATLPPTISQLFLIIGGLAGIVGVVGLFAQLQYFGKLAERIPDRPLSSRAIFLKKMLPGCYLVLLVAGIGAALMARGGAPSSSILVGLGCFAGLIAIAFLVFGIMYLLMIEKFSKRFKEQSLLAAQNWAAHATGPTAS